MIRLIWILWLLFVSPFLLLGLAIGAVIRPQATIVDSNLAIGHLWTACRYKPRWGKE